MNTHLLRGGTRKFSIGGWPWRRNRGHRRKVPTPLFKDSGKVPSWNLGAFFENFEDTKLNRQIHMSGNFRSQFQNLPGEYAPWPPSWFKLRGWLNINPFLSCKTFCREVFYLSLLNPCAPSTYVMLPTSLWLTHPMRGPKITLAGHQNN